MIRGTLIESDHQVLNIANAITNFFEDPILQKIDHLGASGIYAVKVHQLVNEHRYIIITAPGCKSPIGSECKMSEVFWNKIETTSYSDALDLFVKPIYFEKKRSKLDAIPIFIKSRENGENIFTSNNNIQVVLGRPADPEKKKSRRINPYDYKNSATLAQALSTFDCLVKL